MGFFAGLGSFVLVARLNSAEAVAGTGYELTVIASVVIGGTSLFGGSGTIFGTVVGTILIGVLLNGLVLLNVSSYIQQIIIGVIIVLAVAFDTFAKSGGARSDSRGRRPLYARRSSFAAAAASISQTAGRSDGRMVWAGNSIGFRGPCSTWRRTSALLSPDTRKATLRAALIGGGVSVSRHIPTTST